MLPGRRPSHLRHEFRFGPRELVVFGAAFVLIWALTFVFGVLVGREFGSPGASAARAGRGGAAAPTARPADPARAAAPPGATAPEERLTFYQTLTAPTPDLPVARPPTIEERIVPREAPSAARRGAAAAPAAGEPTGERAAGERPAPPGASPEPPGIGSVGRGARSPRPGVPAPAPAAQSVSAPEARLWTVQVSSFRSRALADELRARLQARGLEAYLVSVSTDEGRVRHRVRVGGYATRAEAERVAAELRTERNLNPFVTRRAR